MSFRLPRFACVLALLASAANAQSQAARRDSTRVAREFVEAFYRWYVPVAIADHNEAAFAIALRQKRSAFSRQLYRALKADLDAQDKSPGDLVGLDADPFLNSQDPCEAFVVGDVTQRGAVFRVEVFSVCRGKRLDQPSTLADVRAVAHQWEFVDFFNADGKDGLLATLKLLAADRGKPPQAPRP